jgi:hypothetical protein
MEISCYGYRTQETKDILTKRAVGTTKQKKKGGKNPTSLLSPRIRKACHSISTALLESVAKIGTQSTMKSNIKTLHEFSPHIPQKTSKGNKSRSTNEMLHADITPKTQ